MARRNDVNVRIGGEETVSREAGKAAKAIRGLGTQSQTTAKSLIATWSQVTIVVAGVMRAWNRASNAARQAGVVYRGNIQAEQRLTQAVRSTSDALGLSTDAMMEHAEALTRVTQFSGGAINSAQAVIASFGRIGGETMPRATSAALDLAAALGTDLNSASRQLGRALADPERATMALRSANVLLTEAQKESIDGFIAAGDQASAMGVILSQVERQFGGFAEAVGQSSVGIAARFENLKSDILAQVGEITTALRTNFLETVLPVLEDMLQWLTDNAPNIYAIFSNIGPIMRETATYIVNLLKDTFKWDNYKDLVVAIWSNFFRVFSAMVQQIPILFGAIMGALDELAAASGKSTGEMFAEAFKEALGSLRTGVQDFTEENITAPIRDFFAGRAGRQQAQSTGAGSATSVNDTLGLTTFRPGGTVSGVTPTGPTLADIAATIASAVGGVSEEIADNLKTALSESWEDVSTTVADIYGDSTGDFTDRLAEILAAGRVEFARFQARETEGIAGGDDDQLLTEATFKTMGRMNEGLTRAQLKAEELARRVQIQKDIDQSLRLADIAQYGAEYVKLNDELLAATQAMTVLMDNGFDRQAEAMADRIIELEQAITDALAGDAPGAESALTLTDALGGLEGIVGMVGDRLGGFAGQLVQSVMAFGPMGFVVAAVTQAAEGLFNVLGPLVNRVLQPLVNLLTLVGEIVGTLLVPVLNALSPLLMMLAQMVYSLLPILYPLEILFGLLAAQLLLWSPIITALAVALEVLMSPVRFMADLFSWAVAKIRFGVVQIAAWLTHPLNANRRAAYIANQGAGDPGRFTSDAFTGLQGRINEILALSAAAPTGEGMSLMDILGGASGITEFGGLGGGTGGVHGGSVTVQHPPDVYIHIHIGEGGVALMGDRELRQVGDVVVRSVEEVLGTGGQVSWLAAGA